MDPLNGTVVTAAFTFSNNGNYFCLHGLPVSTLRNIHEFIGSSPGDGLLVFVQLCEGVPAGEYMLVRAFRSSLVFTGSRYHFEQGRRFRLRLQ